MISALVPTSFANIYQHVPTSTCQQNMTDHGHIPRAYLGVALVISMLLFGLMMWKVRALADSTERTLHKTRSKKKRAAIDAQQSKLPNHAKPVVYRVSLGLEGPPSSLFSYAFSYARKPMWRRIYRILTESSAMTMGWLLMYWVACLHSKGLAISSSPVDGFYMFFWYV